MAEQQGQVPIPGDHQNDQPGFFLDPQSHSEVQMIQTMDQLRALRIESASPLPQLIVCGAQSAGKSSVLGAITGVPFPSGDQMCTRYVTKVTLAYSPKDALSVRIMPGRSRTPDAKERLERFKRPEHNYHDTLENLQENLKSYMQEANRCIFPPDEEEPAISDDILVITIAGPNKRALQLVDLPGLIEFHSNGVNVVNRIESLALKYLKMKQSTILAIVPASNDLANAKVLTWCREHDALGERTLGIITKPDAATTTPDYIINVVEGRDPGFSTFQWHVLRNLDRQAVEDNTTAAERDRQEHEYFQAPIWNELSTDRRGVDQLRTRLREMYFTAAKRELPRFQDQVNKLLAHKKFNCLNDNLSDDVLQRAFQQAIKRLKHAARDHAKGTYRYDINKLPDDSPAKLRSRIRSHDVQFRDDIRQRGAKWQSHAGMEPADPHSELFNGNRPPTPPSSNTFADISAEIVMASEKLGKTGGIELEGHYNPERINSLFWELSEGWFTIAEGHVQNIFSCCKEYFDTITKITFARTADNKRQTIPGTVPNGFENSETVASRFVEKHLLLPLTHAREQASEELNRIEGDRQDWMKNSDRRFLVKQKEHRQNVVFRSSVRERRAQQNGTGLNGLSDNILDTDTVAKQRELSRPEDYRLYSAEEQLHAMQAHYEISRDVFISNVLMQVEERHFLRNLEDLIPDYLDLDSIKELVREDNDSVARREQLQEERNRLMQAFDALQRCQLTA